MIRTIFGSAMLISLAAAVSNSGYGQSKTKIKAPQSAPLFTSADVNGNPIRLADYKGKKVLLSFYRNVGCPICNLRFHELQQQVDYFKRKGLILVSVYESTSANMKLYTDGASFYGVMIPDPEQNLYSLYQVDKSMEKMMKGMFHGAMAKMKKGKKLFRQNISQDGSAFRIGADFLIDEKGEIQKAYYGKYVGDHLPVADIREFLE